MLGLQFEDCNSFGFAVIFNDCQLNHSSFYEVKLNKTKFKNCKLQEVDFTDSDLTEASFDNCDFLKATFKNTIIERADFRSSYNYEINLEQNRIKGAKFSLKDVVGLLSQYQIKID
jgi:uncharacterized protein YjbI with pentapeptide repeats